MIPRLLKKSLKARWQLGKALVVMAPRQVGKTTLLKNLCNQQGLLADVFDHSLALLPVLLVEVHIVRAVIHRLA